MQAHSVILPQWNMDVIAGLGSASEEPTMTLSTVTSLQPSLFDQPTPDRTAFTIGWDHARHRLTPPPEHLHEGHPVRLGWEAGAAVFAARSLRATLAVRRWLQLRLASWKAGRSFEDVQLTPRWLAQIDVPICPVTEARLTQSIGAATDAVVEHLNPDAACAAGNLALLSRQASRARAAQGWREAVGLARRAEAQGLDQIEGLSAAQWMRLAVLISFAQPLPHAAAAALPLLVLPPPRVRLLNPAQALQVLVTLRCIRAGQPARIDELARLFPESARTSFCVFATTLLARQIAAGPDAGDDDLRRAMLAAWTQPLVQQRWQRLALRLSAAQCESIVQTAVARGLAAPGMRCLTLDQATDGWSLDSAGRLPAVITVGASLPEPAPRRALNATSTALRLPSVRPARRLHA